MATLKVGSSGSSVTELQKLLNQAGYSISVDGSYGSQTAAAVKAYQQANGLSVDGIAGTQTLGSLQGTSPTAQPASYSSLLQEMAGSVPQYSAPPSYVSAYSSQIQDMLNKITSREKFSYDFNADPLYNQYKDQYVRQGQLAMQDTMGEAAALSGGYGNSYATTAGQAAYQNYLSGLNNIIPQLRDAAYSMYQGETTDLNNQLAAYQNMDAADYEKYQGSVAANQNAFSNQLAAWDAQQGLLQTLAAQEAAAATAAKKPSGPSNYVGNKTKDELEDIAVNMYQSGRDPYLLVKSSSLTSAQKSYVTSQISEIFDKVGDKKSAARGK